ncbi:hypothetical protein Nos7524_1204 [Nostoc sp. PCC 7524]|uniref:hypothetical protein n=1 Tax=Nostoc sp. (strain ATCC 29411 / PCC 7524) TaxID=28072 RepID=UPI00029F4AEC|nr:hypothetical protein [Nostoc sp. PCC 7524]AFY47093.1 hypothetical protein Nos7524_1204 [Nostoc sp. PCC 7524]
MTQQQVIIKNYRIFTAWLQALLEKGCPYLLAESVAIIVANTDTDEPNLGTFDGEKRLISMGLKYLVNIHH